MGLDSRHVILTASPYFSSTPSSGFCGFFFLFWALWNCQSSQWPGQALSLWRWALKWCQPSSMDEVFEKGTMNWKKKGKNPSYLGNKTKGRRENVEEREKGGGMGGVTGWPSLLSIPQPILSPRTERQAFLVLRSDREKGRDEKKREKESESLPKRGREQERREWQGGGMEGEQLESLSSAPSRWIGLMNASECWGAMASSIKAGNTAQI